MGGRGVVQRGHFADKREGVL